jgi:8-oxo-dGTP diphosphatase
MRQPAPRVRAAAFIVQHGRLLLVRQQKREKTYWLLPGGGVERGETVSDALAREVREECGLVINVLLPPLGMVEAISPDRGEARHTIQLIYAAEPTDASPVRPRDPAIVEWRWAEATELYGLVLHPPIPDLMVAWLEEFSFGRPARWPEFVAAGVRWVD